MRKLLIPLFMLLIAQILCAQGSPPEAASGQSYSVEYYYKVQWGHQQEFLQLFPEEPLPAAAEAGGALVLAGFDGVQQCVPRTFASFHDVAGL